MIWLLELCASTVGGVGFTPGQGTKIPHAVGYSKKKKKKLKNIISLWIIIPYAGKDWRQEEKGKTRMRWLDSIASLMDVEFEQTHWDDEEQGNPSPRGLKELDIIGQPNHNNNWLIKREV